MSFPETGKTYLGVDSISTFCSLCSKFDILLHKLNLITPVQLKFYHNSTTPAG